MNTTDPGTITQTILDAVQARNWQYAAVLGLIGLVSFLRWLAPRLHDKAGAFLRSQRGGTVLVLASGVLATAAASAAMHQLSFSVIIGGLMTSVMASGGWNVFWDIFAPDPPSPVSATPAIQLDGPKPAPTITMLLPLAFLMAFQASCGFCDTVKHPENADTARCKTEAVFLCAADGVANVAESIAGTVATALLSSDYNNLLDQIVATLTSKGIPNAVNVVSCAVAKATGGSGAIKAANLAAISTRGQLWLKNHPAVKLTKAKNS